MCPPLVLAKVWRVFTEVCSRKRKLVTKAAWREIKGRKKWPTSGEMKNILVNTCWILCMPWKKCQKQHPGGHWDPQDSLQTQRPKGFLMVRKRIPYVKTLVGVGDRFLYTLTENIVPCSKAASHAFCSELQLPQTSTDLEWPCWASWDSRLSWVLVTQYV